MTTTHFYFHYTRMHAIQIHKKKLYNLEYEIK